MMMLLSCSMSCCGFWDDPKLALLARHITSVRGLSRHSILVSRAPLLELQADQAKLGALLRVRSCVRAQELARRGINEEDRAAALTSVFGSTEKGIKVSDPDEDCGEDDAAGSDGMLLAAFILVDDCERWQSCIQM